MKDIILSNGIVKFHSTLNDKQKSKVLSLISLYEDGKINVRTLNNKKFKVITVNNDIRVLIKNEQYLVMTHEKYNKFITR